MSTPPHLRLPACASARTFDTARGPVAAHDALPPGGAAPRATAILVPGLTGSKEDFLPLLEPLAAAGFRAVAVDQRGQFETPGPADAAAYALDALGADLLAVAGTVAAGEPVHLVGHSFGGLAVRAAAIAEPAALASVTLLCSGPGPISGNEAARATMLLEALDVLSLADIWTFASSMAAANGEHDGVPPDVLEFLGRRFTASSPAGLAAMARQLLDTPDRVGELAATGLPVLVAHGVDDFIWLPAEQAQMARRLGARHEALPGAAHSPAVERPAQTSALLVDFWASLTAAT